MLFFLGGSPFSGCFMVTVGWDLASFASVTTFCSRSPALSTGEGLGRAAHPGFYCVVCVCVTNQKNGATNNYEVCMQDLALILWKCGLS